MIISICGKSGSGKSYLAKEIAKNIDGIVIDIDKIGHQVLTFEEVKEQLVKSFGEDILISGNIDRKKLGKIVFSDSMQMQVLTDITWPCMNEIVDDIILKNSDKVIILDWQLLPKTKFFKLSDKKILLDIPFDIRKKRIEARDKIVEEKILEREKASYSYNKDDFDVIIDNILIDDVKGVIDRIWE